MLRFGDRFGRAEEAYKPPEEYELEPTRSPSEADVLRMLLAHVEDARWQARIEQRLKELG